MSDSVTFKGDARIVAALAVEASTGERPDVALITNPTWVGMWRGRPVQFMCRVIGDPRDQTFVMLHCQRVPFTNRPWASKYPDAASIVRAAGLQITEERSYEEHFKKG